MDWPAIPLPFGLLLKDPLNENRFARFLPCRDVLPKFRFVHTSLWVTNGRTRPKGFERLEQVHALKSLKKEGLVTRWAFGDVGDGIVLAKDTHLRHHREGRFFSKFSTQDVPLSGEYLSLHIFANPPHHKLETLTDEAIRIINIFRLNCGAGIASDLAAEFAYDRARAKQSSRITSPEPTEVQEGFRHLAAEDGSFGTVCFELVTEKFSHNISHLLDLSIQQHSSALRFLLTWMVVELTIGTGKERGNFCEGELGSKTLSRELKRLHDVRSKILKDGQLKSNPEDIGMLLWFIRLRLCATGPLRDQSVAACEKWIALRGDPPPQNAIGQFTSHKRGHV